MTTTKLVWGNPRLTMLAAVVAVAALALLARDPARSSGAALAAEEASAGSWIVQGESVSAAERLVRSVGGVVTARLEIIDAVGSRLHPGQVETLRGSGESLTIYRDARLEIAGGAGNRHYATQVGADALHRRGITGAGVTIAVLDTGLWRTPETEKNSRGRARIRASWDAISATAYGAYGDDDDECDDDDDWRSFGECAFDFLNDWNGHGTHITSAMASSARDRSGRYLGVAPDAGIVAIRAFEADGSGTYLNVLKALDWIVRHRDRYDIRVLNLSFGAPAASHYWDDPVNQAVMVAWARGITVVVAAGNGGPGPMTVGVPGNVPYVLTVGAYTDNGTPTDESDDRLTRFSAAGPTIEGFVKPDVVAPGGHILGLMPPYAWLPLQYPEYVRRVDDSFMMSGTSQAAAIVSGVVALMLDAEPALSPDEVKCRLLASARGARKPDGSHAYTVFQQGAGRVDASAAVAASVSGCGNRGLDIHDDLAGRRHFVGPAGVDDAGTHYLVDEYGERLGGSGYEWIQGSLWPEGALWVEGSLQGAGSAWDGTVDWRQAGSLNADSLLSQGSLWPEGEFRSEGHARRVATYQWVNQE